MRHDADRFVEMTQVRGTTDGAEIRPGKMSHAREYGAFVTHLGWDGTPWSTHEIITSPPATVR